MESSSITCSSVGLPDAFCKNTGHFDLSTVPDLSRVVFRKRYRENRDNQVVTNMHKTFAARMVNFGNAGKRC